MIQARNLVPGIGDYSTSEQDTGFTWVDGKHIYKKTLANISITYSDSTTISIEHNISSLDKIIKMGGSAKATNGQWWAIPAALDQNGLNTTNVRASDTYLYLNFKTNALANGIAYITLYYTKSS